MKKILTLFLASLLTGCATYGSGLPAEEQAVRVAQCYSLNLKHQTVYSSMDGRVIDIRCVPKPRYHFEEFRRYDPEYGYYRRGTPEADYYQERKSVSP
jgi:hypothetical protein